MEKIKSACIKYRLVSDPEKDRFITAHDHSYCRDWFSCAEIYENKRILEHETEGFMTTTGRFVDRNETYQIAKTAGQLRVTNTFESLRSYEVNYSND